jgi:DNA modification methylase
MSYQRKEIIGDCTLYLGDCMEVMPTLGKVDAVITDPPYGIGADKGKGIGKSSFNGSKPIESREYKKNNWDKERPDHKIFSHILSLKTTTLIWGGNYFADLLPPQGKWLWWDKCQTMPTFGDGELAWTNLKGTTPKKFTYANNKIFALKEKRYHPTEKPLALMKWCVELLPSQADVILDPFMGSGTTGVACAKMGRTFIGIELEEKYFDIACKRIEEAYKQPDMFVEQVKETKQETLI